jgi:hypothetical protein
MVGRKQCRNAALASLLALVALSACGCHWLYAWMAADRHPKEQIKAEYALKAERLVIVTYAGAEILFNDATAPLEVSYNITNEILRSLSSSVKTVVRPEQVVRWQESTLEWPNMSLVDIAKTFQADTVLYIELERYTMIEERSANLFRGRIRARVQVAKASAERNPVYEATIESTFPEDRQVGVLETSEQVIRTGVTRMFAREVIQKFYEHEIDVRGGRP